jgi:hypothetical protein
MPPAVNDDAAGDVSGPWKVEMSSQSDYTRPGVEPWWEVSPSVDDRASEPPGEPLPDA